jgi:hypothetical protein
MPMQANDCRISLFRERMFNFRDVCIKLDGDILFLGNEVLERKLDLEQGMPKTISLKYLSSRIFLTKSQTSDDFDFSFAGLNFPGGKADTQFSITNITACVNATSWRDGEHVRVEIHIRENIQDVSFIRTYRLYPGKPFISVQNSIKSSVMANIYWSRRSRLDQPEDYTPEMQESVVDSLSLAEGIVPRKAVEFRGRTDIAVNAQVMEYIDPIGLVKGNLLFCEGKDCGLFILQEAPPSAERRDFEDHDLRIENNNVFSCCWGIPPAEIRADKFLHSYRHVIGIYSNGNEQYALKSYLKLRFPEAEKDYTVTVNPWGMGNFRDCVSEHFFLDEIAAAADIGATHYQVDDGWQKGRALQELTTNNRYIKPDFWEVSKAHLPDGFDVLSAQAEKNGVELALWVAPSFTNEYRDWQKFSDILFDYYSRYGIRMFKVDGIKVRTKEAEDNLEMLFRDLRERSGGEIIFNLDTTNGQRPGYFMFLEYGNIFLENRYVCLRNAPFYHPESTLKNLWRLSKYVRPQILQIEVPSPEDINHEYYREKQLISPDIYPPEYWLAIAMFANPLIWLAPSLLSCDMKKIFKQMIDLHLKYRKEIFDSEIYPIGNEPDGRSFTGFIAGQDDGKQGFILLFREAGAPDTTLMDIPYIKSPVIFHKVGGNEGKIYCDSSCQFKIEIAQPGNFIFMRFNSN